MRRLRVVQNPHHFRLGGHRIAYKTGHNASWREKVRPARPSHRHFREKTRPASTKTPNVGCFERAGRTLSRLGAETEPQGELFRARTHHQAKQGELFRAQNTATCDVETNDASAAADARQHETAITIASPQHPKNQHFPRAKVSPVSSQHSLRPAKVSPVSSRRSSALDTAPMHQIEQHCTGN